MTRHEELPTMSHPTLSTADLEQVYDALADGLDRAPEAQRLLFLTKLSLLLARELGDRARYAELLQTALREL